MTASLRACIRKVLVTIGRHALFPLALPSQDERPSGGESAAALHMLVSSATWRIGLLAVSSLERETGMKWKLVVHDDGTAGTAGREAYGRHFPGSRWIGRAEADERARKVLPEVCRTMRSRHNYLMKVTDTLLFREPGRFVIFDADVLFFSRADALADWGSSGDDPRFLYMRDTKEAYCHPRTVLEQRTGLVPAPELNAGICCVPEGRMDLGRCEKVLAEIAPDAPHPMFFDQTLLALAAGEGVSEALPATYEISWNILRQREAVCRHYVGPAKMDLLYIEGPSGLARRRILRK